MTKVSQSQLNLFLNCAEAYRRRYIEGEIIPPGVAMLRGTGVHGAAEENHKQKRDSGRDLPVKDLADIAASTFDRAVGRQGYWLAPEERTVGGKLVLGRAKDAAVRLTGLYADAVAPAIQPDLVEEFVEIALPDDVTMTAILDVTTQDGRLKDLKTAARSKSQADADGSLQLSWYSLAYRAKKGVDPTGIDLEVLVDTKVPKHQRLTTTRTKRDFEVLIARLNTMLAAVKAGVFPPAAVGAWNCSEKWCGYWETCPLVNSERNGNE